MDLGNCFVWRRFPSAVSVFQGKAADTIKAPTARRAVNKVVLSSCGVVWDLGHRPGAHSAGLLAQLVLCTCFGRLGRGLLHRTAVELGARRERAEFQTIAVEGLCGRGVMRLQPIDAALPDNVGPLSGPSLQEMVATGA